MTHSSTTDTIDIAIVLDELALAVLRGARAMAVALEDLTEAPDAVHAAEAEERLDLTVRLTAEIARLYDDEVSRAA
jgi:hypothetical protein